MKGSVFVLSCFAMFTVSFGSCVEPDSHQSLYGEQTAAGGETYIDFHGANLAHVARDATARISGLARPTIA